MERHTHAAGNRLPSHALDELLLHDDPARKFEYTAGAEKSLERAAADGWTGVSIKNDRAAIFAES